MKKYTQEEFNHILTRHKKWIDSDKIEGDKADFSNSDCSNLTMREANMRWADTTNANMSWATMRGVDIGDKNIYSISGIGSARRMTTYDADNNVIWCGCFTGTIEEFEKQVKENHKDNPKYLNQYLAAIEYFKKLNSLKDHAPVQKKDL